MESSSASRNPFSFREKVYIRNVTLLKRLPRQDVTRGVINTAVLDANDGDESKVTLVNFLYSEDVVKNVYERPGRPHNFLPHAFGTKMVLDEVSGSTLRQL